MQTVMGGAYCCYNVAMSCIDFYCINLEHASLEALDLSLRQKPRLYIQWEATLMAA